MQPIGHRITIAVLPLEVPNIMKLKPEEANLRRFEQKYFATRLVQTLRTSPWVQEAYLAPESTPSVDYVLSGDIKQGNGETTTVKLRLTRCCDAQVFARTFSADIRSKDFKQTDDPSQFFWNGVVNAIDTALGDAPATDFQRIHSERQVAYVGTSSATLSTKGQSLVKSAAQVEREKLLQPITSLGITEADAATPAFQTWEKSSTELLEDQRSKSHQEWFNFGMMLFVAAAGGYSAGLSGETTMDPNTQMALDSMTQQNTELSEEQSKIADALKDLNIAFSSNAQTLTIDWDGRTYKLRGTLDGQLAELRRIVRERLHREQLSAVQ